MMNFISLRNGVELPQIGIGTWQITDREIMSSVISDAYSLGYRFIDTAAAYSNEISIAKAIEKAGIPRNELILSDKVWNTARGYTEVQEACKKSLKKMKTDYFDLYLVHWPASMKLYDNYKEINGETWRGMERLYKDGFVRAIGGVFVEGNVEIEFEECNKKILNDIKDKLNFNDKDILNAIYNCSYAIGIYIAGIINEKYDISKIVSICAIVISACAITLPFIPLNSMFIVVCIIYALIAFSSTFISLFVLER